MNNLCEQIRTAAYKIVQEKELDSSTAKFILTMDNDTWDKFEKEFNEGINNSYWVINSQELLQGSGLSGFIIPFIGSFTVKFSDDVSGYSIDLAE